MADDKKNIPDAGKVNEPAKAENTEPMKADPAVPEQPAPSKPETPAVEDTPKAAVPPVAEKAPTPGTEQPAPSKQDNPKGKDKPTPPKEDKPQPGKTDQQVTIPGMGDPASAGKVVDFTAARDGTAKGKPPEKDTAPDKGKQPEVPTPRRGRPPKESKSAPGSGQEEGFPHSGQWQGRSCCGVQATTAGTACRAQGRHPPGQGGDCLPRSFSPPRL